MSEQTYYRWRKEYGGLRMDQARRLKELEQENARLKKVVGSTEMLNLPLGLSATPPRISGPAPEFGQHTEQILVEELGMSSTSASCARSA